MGNVLVIYDTRSGNTRKMAEHVAAGAEAVEGTTVRLKHISEADGQDLVWCDGAAVGSPTHMGQPSWQIKKWFDESGVWGQCDGRVGVAFSSEGGHAGGAMLTCTSLGWVLMNYGFLVMGITDYAYYAYTLHYGATSVREPRAPGDIAACRELGKRLALAVRQGHLNLREEGETGPNLHPNKPTESA